MSRRARALVFVATLSLAPALHAQDGFTSLKLVANSAAPSGTVVSPMWPSAETYARKVDPKPFAAFSASALAIRDSLVTIARAQVGRRYRTGGTNPAKGFDCSGLVRYVASALRISLPRTAREQATVGQQVAKDEGRLLPGDLLTFGKGRVSHIGIYIGNGRMIHASSKAGRVVETKIDSGRIAWVKPWRGVRRVLTDGDY